jgi:AraC-like DNA-binding protein
MQIVNSILSAFVYFGGFFALLLAVQQITVNRRSIANIIRFFHMSTIGITIFGEGLIANTVPVQYPVSIFLYLTAVFLVGPCYLLSISSLLGIKTSLKKADIFHFLPALIVLIVEIVFQLQSDSYKRNLLGQFIYSPMNTIIAPVMVLVLIHIETYIAIILKNVVQFRHEEETRPVVRLITLRAITGMFATLLFVAAFLLTSPTFMLVAGTIVTANWISVFISQDYYPRFFFALKKEIQKKRYERSLLAGLSTEKISQRLDELMKEEYLYKDIELTLPVLAGKLSMTPHQLSQFLNEQLHMNFSNCVNNYRIGDAKRLLTENKMSISQICYEVGFGSKSTFYTVFKEMTGKTPVEFRNDTRAGKDKLASQI